METVLTASKGRNKGLIDQAEAAKARKLTCEKRMHGMEAHVAELEEKLSKYRGKLDSQLKVSLTPPAVACASCSCELFLRALLASCSCELFLQAVLASSSCEARVRYPTCSFVQLHLRGAVQTSMRISSGLLIDLPYLGCYFIR